MPQSSVVRAATTDVATKGQIITGVAIVAGIAVATSLILKAIPAVKQALIDVLGDGIVGALETPGQLFTSVMSKLTAPTYTQYDSLNDLLTSNGQTAISAADIEQSVQAGLENPTNDPSLPYYRPGT